MSFNLPHSYLIGMLLVVSTHSGPQLLFSYPSEPEEFLKGPDMDSDTDSYMAESESDNESFIDESIYDATNNRYYETKKDLISYLADKEKLELTRTVSSRSTTSNNTKTNSSKPKTLFGFEPDVLCDMLSPPRDMCNSRFDLQIDDLVFLGLPIHSRNDKTWRPGGTASKHSLNMFHLVFVMNPPILECNYRIDEMFHYVVSRLSLVLRYEQAKREYIGKEVSLILRLKEEFQSSDISPATPTSDNNGMSIPKSKDTDLTSYLVENSSLCKLIADCYNAISRSEIANLTINNKLRSFQIPLKTEFHSLPAPTVPYLPGSHLSSTVKFLGDTSLVNIGITTRYDINTTPVLHEESENFESDIGDRLVHFSLLLLDDPDSIVKDIKAEPHSTLSHFIHSIKPTESLLKLYTRLKQRVSLDQIKSFAFHLVYWRRARVIPPLSAKAVYIVSPMAPVAIKLDEDQNAFQLKFPTLPSLSYFLKQISSSSSSRKPRQFSTIIPSKDHREPYIEALAWIVRHGYVTQLHTFLWIKITKRIKMLVEADLESEGVSKRQSYDKHNEKHNSKLVDNSSKDIKKVDNSSKPDDSKVAESYPSSFVSILEDNNGPQILLEEIPGTIIVDPDRSSPMERRWINKVVEECKLSPYLSSVFYKLLKHFNGRTSLEVLLLEESVVRSDLRKLLAAMEEYIVSVKHW